MKMKWRKIDKSNMVEQDVLIEIFKNPELFKKYVTNSNKKITSLYALYIVNYYYYLKNHDCEINNAQEEMVNECRKIRDKEYYCYDDFFEESQERKRRNVELRDIVINLASDDKKLKDFFIDNTTINGTTCEELCEYMKKSCSIGSYCSNGNLYFKNNKLARNIHLLAMYCKHKNKSFDNKDDEQFEIDEELKAKIYKEVSQELLNKRDRTNEETVELAYQLFCSLNKTVVFDEIMLIEDQHKLDDYNSNGIINKAYYKNPGDVKPDDNGVACRSWSYLYAKLLNDVNINAFVDHSSRCT